MIDLEEISNSAFGLPVCLFTTQSLAVLQLTFNNKLKFPDDNSDEILINFPNLKELNLRLCDSNRVLMRTLLKSCPLLEGLLLSTTSRFEEDHFVIIVAPNLKDLKIYMEGGYSPDHNCVFSIDAPNLEHFNANDQLSFYHFVNNPRALQEAIVTLPRFDYERDDYLSRMVPLFQGISCARYLTFSCIFPGLFLMDVTLPIFHNITNLRVDCEIWESDNHVPRCLLINLKTLVVVNIEPIDKGIRFLEQFLSNATVLEQLDVYSTADVDYDDLDYYGDAYGIVGMEYKFCMELLMLPRSSSNCLVNYFGSIFTASSNAFRNGKLVCEITNRIEQLG